eukprot:scaffold421973_cov15-Prasinocladus_malaysianus.AAC.1
MTPWSRAVRRAPGLTPDYPSSYSYEFPLVAFGADDSYDLAVLVPIELRERREVTKSEVRERRERIELRERSTRTNRIVQFGRATGTIYRVSFRRIPLTCLAWSYGVWRAAGTTANITRKQRLDTQTVQNAQLLPMIRCY